MDFANSLHFWSILAVFWLKTAKKGRNPKKEFCRIFVVDGKHLYTKFQKISSNSLDFANFLNFWSILAVFWLKNDQKMPESKKKNCKTFFVGKHLHSKFQKISSNGLDFSNFFFGCFLAIFCLKNGQKRPKSEKSFFVAFFC